MAWRHLLGRQLVGLTGSASVTVSEVRGGELNIHYCGSAFSHAVDSGPLIGSCFAGCAIQILDFKYMLMQARIQAGTKAWPSEARSGVRDNAATLSYCRGSCPIRALLFSARFYHTPLSAVTIDTILILWYVGTPSAIARALSITSTPRRPRSEKKPIPDDMKDNKYFERRKRNNMAAKKSRDARKSREDEIAIRASFLEKENAILRAQVATLREEANSLRQLLLQKRSQP
ncbi:hypothetical protein LSH36_622g01014 [Paralvinella palmiformis]|uniref:BZIP domain-containing protein n=1 Tax=Paralvinella palmiformis TaxID=53620 RepID=A0AAD9J564_9ANNE|nr:hypothetical protein LSH36_622g01014 [Paralvinella palmiformis]